MSGEWKKREDRCLQGSYTVEAAVLVPIILAVIIALMQICLVFHDRVVIRGVVELAALQAVQTSGETETGQKAEGGWKYMALLKESIEAQLLISEITDAGIRETRTDTEVFVQMESRRLVPLYFGNGNGFRKEYSSKQKKQYAKEKTIISEVLLDTLHLLE